MVQTCEFLAPVHLHTEITDKLQALADIRVTFFQISNPALDVLISKEPEQLLSIVKSKCYLEKSIETFRESISVPRARVTDSDVALQSTASARSTETITMNMGRSTVTISIGDLTTQAVGRFS